MGKKSTEKTELVIVTGLSGAGKSRAVDALEDIGFFCVDNMPPKLIPTFVKLIFNSNEKRDRVAIVADIRLGDSFSDIFGVLDELKEDEINYKILFIDADNDVIMRRYQETRRKHPLADEFNTPSILEAIQKEREILLPARRMLQALSLRSVLQSFFLIMLRVLLKFTAYHSALNTAYRRKLIWCSMSGAYPIRFIFPNLKSIPGLRLPCVILL